MKVNAFKYLVQALLVFQSLLGFGQTYDPNANVPRGVLGGVIFIELFGSNYDVNDHPAVNFPSPYVDLQDNSHLWNQLKVVSFLSHGNAVSPFYSETKGIAFKPYDYSGRASAIMNLLEACNIAPASSGSEPFSDVVNGDYYYPYLVKAYQLNIIRSSDGSNFRPYSNVTNAELVLWITRMKALDLFDFSTSELENLNNYLVPQNYYPLNNRLPSGLEHGVFNHYAKSSFSIPDIKLNLSFDHFYSSLLAELPLGMYPITPLGKGWSHTYNSYVVFNEIENDDIYSIVWPDGTIHHYNDDSDEYLSKGIFDKVSFQDSKRTLIITHKDQSVHEYYKEDTSEPIWYLRRIKDKNGNTIRIYYDDNLNDNYQHITKVRSPSGKELLFWYNSSGLLEEVEDPSGRTISFEFSGTSAGWFYQYPVLSAFTDAKGNVTTYSYSAPTFGSHLLTRVGLPRGNVIYASYNKDRKVSQIKVNNEAPINLSFEINHSSSSNTFKSNIQTTLPNGSIETNTYTFDKNENFKGLINNTQNVEVSYPSSGNLIHLPSRVLANEKDTRFTYDSRGNVTRVTIKGTSFDIIENFVYDTKNNLIQYYDPEGNVTNFYYDTAGKNLLKIQDADGNDIVFTYDALGQLLSTTNQEGITITFIYDSSGAIVNIIAPEGVNISQNYDILNRLRARIENGIPTYFDYDKNDNLIKITEPLGYITQYEYNENDYLKRIINAKGVHQSFEYNDEDQVVSNSFNSLFTYYDYEKGQLSSITKPSNAVIGIDYDTKGRINSTGEINDIDYTSNHEMASIANNVGRIYFKYDEFKRVSEVKTVHDKIIKYSYRKTGQTNRIEYPQYLTNTARVDYFFDIKNRTNSINFIFNGTIYRIADFTFRKDDKTRTILWGNGVLRINLFDGLGRVNGLEIKKPNGTNIYLGKIDYDVHSNISKELEWRAPYPINVPPNDPPPANLAYTFDNSNFITSGAGKAYQINADGNTVLLNNGDQTATFSLEDRLLSFTNFGNPSIFKYDAFGQRVEAARSGVITKYIRDVLTDNVLVELDGAGVPLYYYIYNLDGTLLARFNFATQKLSYYHGDIRGSVIAITDETGNITHHYEYEDFGAISYIYEPANEPNRFRYVGTLGVEYENDDLYYMRARYYQPSTGRFLSQDPVWSTNLYVYADNNPITNVDPDGDIIETAWDVANVSMGVGSAVANWSKGNYGDAVIDGVGAALDAGAAIFPGVPAGASAGIKAYRVSKSVKNAAKTGINLAKQATVHGNSLKSLKPTWGYKLYSTDGIFLKNGITSAVKAESRYTKTFLSDKVMLEKTLFPNRAAAYKWEYKQNQSLRGPLNFNMH